jgi:hypothetical protein
VQAARDAPRTQRVPRWSSAPQEHNSRIGSGA